MIFSHNHKRQCISQYKTTYKMFFVHMYQGKVEGYLAFC